jgi:hypothetical protein
MITKLMFIIIIILLIYLCYIIFDTITYESFDTMIPSQHKNNIVVLIKTHIWTDDLEKFIIKLKNETLISGVDFYVLMHYENNKPINNNKELSKYILRFNEDDIKKMYRTGY